MGALPARNRIVQIFGITTALGRGQKALLLGGRWLRQSSSVFEFYSFFSWTIALTPKRERRRRNSCFQGSRKQVIHLRNLRRSYYPSWVAKSAFGNGKGYEAETPKQKNQCHSFLDILTNFGNYEPRFIPPRPDAVRSQTSRLPTP